MAVTAGAPDLIKKLRSGGDIEAAASAVEKQIIFCTRSFRKVSVERWLRAAHGGRQPCDGRD